MTLYVLRDLVTMDEVGSGRVPSLERVTTGVGSATGAETKKLDSLGTSSRPSWLGLSLSIALLSNTLFTVKKYRNLLVPIYLYLYGKFGFYYNTKRYTLYRPFSNGDGRRNEAKQLLQSDLDNNSSSSRLSRQERRRFHEGIRRIPRRSMQIASDERNVQREA